MTMDREKEREIELESAMYTNCLLLGMDSTIIGVGGSSPRVGQFRHSNPKLGEQLLYFIISSLRGPVQSSKDFDKVWPIFDSVQSRDFRKVVQGIISELESQGALPRSNSRVSSLATCCGPRFVELLWQLSLHALREVHRRTFATDVASNPLPASLTNVAFSHAATLLPVTKARISLERRRFLKNAETVVQQQAMWSNLAHEMTAEFRGLCAEEACLQQELEKFHDMRNKIKLEGELWDDLVSSSSQNSHLVAKATRAWESILARKSQHDVLASGPIEDLIAHREHRYRISGSSLLAAVDQSSQGTDISSFQSYDLAYTELDEKEWSNKSYGSINTDGVNNISDLSQSLVNEEIVPQVDGRSGRVHSTVDLAEIIRRWAHALQRIHKQSLHLAKANDGEGPEILRSTINGSSGGHADSLAATLAEHQQHLASLQVLFNQLKEVAPAIQKSISECTEEVNSISSSHPSVTKHPPHSMSPIQVQSGRSLESGTDDITDVSSTMSSVQLGKMSASPTLKLPQLFSLTPNSSGKSGNAQKRQIVAAQASQIESLSGRNSFDQPTSINHIENVPRDIDNFHVQNLRKSVREAALSTKLSSSEVESSRNSHSDESVEHFFVPISSTVYYPSGGLDSKAASIRSKKLVSSQVGASFIKTRDIERSGLAETLNDLEQVNGFFSNARSNYAEAEDQVFSPPLLMDPFLLTDSYEDLLAPLSETETALMER